MYKRQANEIPEDKMIEAIYKAHDINQTIIAFIEKIVSEVGKEKHSYESCAIPAEMFEAMKQVVSPEEMEVAVFTDDKQTREKNIDAVTEKMKEAFADNEEWLAVLGEAVYQYQKKTVRKMILKDHKRPDGRAIDQIRPLAAEVDLIPRVHGSAMFTRGQTQICDVVTLAPLSEVQKIDGLDENVTTKRYMHQYNMPPYSVGETRPVRSPGRREIGHGALAERALLPMIPSEEEFPYALRLVSEVISSNGSTSQASICASTLSLMDAGVPIKKPVAGVAMGLIKDPANGNIAVMTDIQGLEDFLGDMDFKVAGTKDGITAIQMDIKIKGIDEEILTRALAQARRGRLFILDKMLETLAQPRAELSPYAPRVLQFSINPDKIREVIGSGGKTINKIIADTGVKIDINDDGRVFILSPDQEASAAAKKMIDNIVKDIEVGEVFLGKVVNILPIGAQVELKPGKKGLVHISKLANRRVEKVEDVVSIGDEILVRVIDIKPDGKIDLTRKGLLPEDKQN